MTLGFLEPCGINTPHLHPRATEMLVLVEGSSLRFGSIFENGLVKPGQNQEVAASLKKFEATAFPQGSMHWQFNDGCEKAIFVAVLNSEDPGTSQLAQNFFGLDAAVVNATLGSPKTIEGRPIEDFRQLIPTNIAQDRASCLTRCKSLKFT
jgi:hypothetical protein